MCADIFALDKTVQALERAETELLHIDIMDGAFVPNFALGTDYVKQLKRGTRIPLDLHFMTEQPERHLDAFAFGEGDYVSIHYETAKHLERTLGMVRERGAKAFLAINPATPIELAIDLLDTINGVLVMTVNPGFAGQKMVPHSIDKIRRVRAFLDENGRADAEIEVDGNVSIENAIRMREAGADIFVLGTSAVFCGEDIEENVNRFRTRVFGG